MKRYGLCIFLLLFSLLLASDVTTVNTKPCPTGTGAGTGAGTTADCQTAINKLGVKQEDVKDTWYSGFVKTFLMILSMEIGDKTFFIGAILSMSHNKWLVFIGSVSALVVMCIISCIIGVTAPILMSRDVTVIIASVLFIFFGVKMIIEGFKKDKQNITEEYEEAEESVRQHMSTDTTLSDAESGLIHSKTKSSEGKTTVNNILIKTFIMVFFAEWGDRSQFSTLILASTHPVSSVIVGATCGYIVSTLCGVLGGNFFARVISPRMISIIGGLLFLIFAVQILITKDSIVCSIQENRY